MNKRLCWRRVTLSAFLILGSLLAACGGGDSGIDTSAETLDFAELSDGTRGNIADPLSAGGLVIQGNPPTSVEARKQYAFKPVARDADGGKLSFEISNKPDWADFSIETGRISGIPKTSYIGTYTNIIITVSNGSNLLSLAPFSITVTPVPGGNQPPAIEGSPDHQVDVGDYYRFKPQASDPDGGALTFSINQKPDWASFNPATGELSGVPTSRDVGTRWGIVISVSDGLASDRLESFSIRVDEPLPVTARKFNPGHYITVYRTDTGGEIVGALREGVVGVQKRYIWKSLEPSQGKYNFAQIERDLATVSKQGAHLVVVIEDKSFTKEKPTPGYLGQYTYANNNNGFTVARWDPFVVRQFSALIEAMGKRFDKHPAFEGVGFQETSLSLPDGALNARKYTPQKYKEAILEVLTAATSSFPRSQVFWFQNFLKGRQEYLDQIANTMASKGIALGGPDVLPDSWDLKTVVYPRYARFKNRMPLFNSIQYDSYAHMHKDTSYPSKYWTPKELFVYARDQLHVDYLFWHKKREVDKGDYGSYTWTDALPVIRSNPAF